MKPYSSKALRARLIPRLFFLSDARKWQLDCWLRGRKEFLKLQRADQVIVSYPKSGRTWLRTMLSRYFQLTCGIPEGELLGFENYHRRVASIPRIFFTHDCVIHAYCRNADRLQAAYAAKPIILLARDPRDVAVSLYFQWKHRLNDMKSRHSPLAANRDASLYEFVLHEECGLPAIIRFLNGWQESLSRRERGLVVRYEDLHGEGTATLARILDFLALSHTPGLLAEVAAYTAFDNMRRIEQRGAYRDRRLLPGDPANPDSFKVRRGKVGGYRDYFDDAQLQHIEALVAERLNPALGYACAATSPARAGTNGA